ncbi:Dienelactone hydrolase [Neofusicoccum parvum]|nr:Dienelactone hydrolase [Neofusicoccum parvum]
MRSILYSTARILRTTQLRPTRPVSSQFRRPFPVQTRFSCAMASQHSHACCTIPPVVTDGYQPKGEYITVDGLKTYRTGPADAKHAILIIYDIFGFFPQTLQGADILATSDKERSYQVFIPDFFEGKPADISWYPPDNEEKGKKLGEFFAGPAAPAKTVARIPKVVDAINSQVSGLSSWGILGFCWGGKVTNLSSTEGTKFKAAVSAHPAMVDPADAEKVSVPYLLIYSKDEDEEAVKNWQKNLKVKGHIEPFKDQIHGFMAARSDLSDSRVKEEYTRGYKSVLAWFHENL